MFNGAPFPLLPSSTPAAPASAPAATAAPLALAAAAAAAAAAPAGEGARSGPHPTDPTDPTDLTKRRKQLQCAVCTYRLPLATTAELCCRCRCGELYCAAHLHQHRCAAASSLKEAQRRVLRSDNPKIAATKLEAM